MSSLKVTIQQSSESRAISTSAADSGSMGNEDSGEELDSMPIKFICYICNVNCYNQKVRQVALTCIIEWTMERIFDHLYNIPLKVAIHMKDYKQA